MNFLGIGPLEVVVIAILAFFLLGPKKMGEAGRSMGKVLREIREQREEFTSILMDSVDPDKKQEAPAAPPAPPTPPGAVAQSGDAGAAPSMPDVEEGAADSGAASIEAMRATDEPLEREVD